MELSTLVGVDEVCFCWRVAYHRHSYRSSSRSNSMVATFENGARLWEQGDGKAEQRMACVDYKV